MRLVSRILADVPAGAIVRFQDRWGVVCIGNNNVNLRNKRIVDFWDGGRELVSNIAVVDVQV